jgi:hypothetical protein
MCVAIRSRYVTGPPSEPVTLETLDFADTRIREIGYGRVVLGEREESF